MGEQGKDKASSGAGHSSAPDPEQRTSQAECPEKENAKQPDQAGENLGPQAPDVANQEAPVDQESQQGQEDDQEGPEAQPQSAENPGEAPAHNHKGQEEPAPAKSAEKRVGSENSQPALQTPTCKADRSNPEQPDQAAPQQPDQAAGEQKGADDFQELSELDVLNLKIADLEQQVAQLKDELARSRAETYNVSQEYSGYVKRAKAEIPGFKKAGQKQVLQLLLAVLDDIYAAQQAQELQGPFASIAQKLQNTLATNFKLECFGEVGEEFDPQLHEALMATESDEVKTAQIEQVLQPGYRWDEEVLRACKVIVKNPV